MHHASLYTFPLTQHLMSSMVVDVATIQHEFQKMFNVELHLYNIDFFPFVSTSIFRLRMSPRVFSPLIFSGLTYVATPPDFLPHHHRRSPDFSGLDDGSPEPRADLADRSRLHHGVYRDASMTR